MKKWWSQSLGFVGHDNSAPVLDFIPAKYVLVPLASQFSWLRDGSLVVEARRTGARLSTGSKPALK